MDDFPCVHCDSTGWVDIPEEPDMVRKCRKCENWTLPGSLAELVGPPEEDEGDRP